MVYGDKSLDALIRDIQSENPSTMAFEYEIREMKMGPTHGRNVFIEYRGANATIVEVCR